MSVAAERRFPVGGEWHGDHASFRVWAPNARHVELAPVERPPIPLEAEEAGYYSVRTTALVPGSLYRFRLDGRAVYPDPASRFQPEGPQGPSMLVDPRRFAWTDHGWKGSPRTGQVLYEMHVGSFTEGGTWSSAMERLPQLAELGVTLLELMPVHDFTGKFGWGYDGVNLFAPTRLYGPPDDFRRFVDRAHSVGLGVILDVVYNHVGPEGNYLPCFADDYFSTQYKTDWGAAFNFDGDNSSAVREFIVSNAAYWIAEYHLDGLRLDATQNIYDASSPHILQALTEAAREAAGGRAIYVVGENEEQRIHHVKDSSKGGFGLDALWNDDFHHTALAALTGRAEAYYSDYGGTPQELISAAKYGYLYQGQRYEWQDQNRGTSSLDQTPDRYVAFLENHDQVANSAKGLRCHQLASPGALRAMTAYLLLGPLTPMLFQGQEFQASAPFLYFADHPPELADQVRRGRKEFLAQFPSLASEEVQERLPDPADRRTFERSKLDWSEWETHHEAVALHRDLLKLRRNDPVLAEPGRRIDGAVLAELAFVLRYFARGGEDRLLLVNLGVDRELFPLPEPLLAPPAGRKWVLDWSSESPRYGGCGASPLWKKKHLFLPGRTALFLVSEPLPRGLPDAKEGQHEA